MRNSEIAQSAPPSCSPAVAGDKVAYALLTGVGGVMVYVMASDRLMDDPASVAGGLEGALRRYTAAW